jgi:uncharacterized protein with HEPN domain
MSKHDDHVSFSDMLSHAREAIDLLGESGHEDLARDRVLQLALTRLVEIIGEAANRVSQDTQQKHPEIPWRQIAGMRNRLVHGYDVIDLDVLWDTIRDDLPPLVKALEEAIDNKS